MSLYSEYIKERTTDLILETDIGFAHYRYVDENVGCYIVDIYTKPEHRQKGEAAGLADQIALEAKSRGAKYLLGSVQPSANNSTTSLKVLLAYGFKLAWSSQDAIFLRKEI